MNFKKGDLVMHEKFGKGKIIVIDDGVYGVEFFNEDEILHDLFGMCGVYKGWWCSDQTITLSEGRAKTYQIPDFADDDVRKVIINEPCVIVFLKNGIKGVAKCCPHDFFNVERGYEIAYSRCKVQDLKNQLERAEKYLKMLTL